MTNPKSEAERPEVLARAYVQASGWKLSHVEGQSDFKEKLEDCYRAGYSIGKSDAKDPNYVRDLEAAVRDMQGALEWYAQKPSPYIVPEELWEQGLRVQTKATEALSKHSDILGRVKG